VLFGGRPALLQVVDNGAGFIAQGQAAYPPDMMPPVVSQCYSADITP
jgi:hypothetical protein